MGVQKDSLLSSSGVSPCVPDMLKKIKTALVAAFSPFVCDVQDESHLHSRGGQSHFKLVLVSDSFVGISRVRRHQLVYTALGDIVQQIHALAIHVYSLDEWQQGESARSHDSPLCGGGNKHDVDA